ncbi:uncharacterized protein [Medicago truncatula]|uniref:uncharacterized protein n=1 Tax=Medicago truncatula TaxID=3880 RepID=UPI001967B0DE|nr:uncharacterized protein LOC112422147 [Medicago truncatula]
MEGLEQENQVLRAEVISLKTKIEELESMKTKMDELSELVKVLSTAQNQPPPPPPFSTQAEASSSSIPDWTICADTPTYSAPQRSAPWFQPFTAGEIFRPIACEAQMPTHQYVARVPPVKVPPVAMTYSAPVMHTIPQNEESIFHSGNMETYDGMSNLREKYDELQRDVKALRGKGKFGKTAYDLCLVPNVQIPHKFKIPDFEKYKGNSCPEEHLKMYVRRMSAYAQDDQVLIYYFQESLAGPASKWYKNLDKTEIQTFRDLCEAFVEQYNYNVDMAPDRSDLQAMTQGDKETFKEYAQRWRDTAAQVSPRIEEKEMTKIFLKTLNHFYYEKMVGKGVREGRLVKDGASDSGAKKFGNNFPRKKAPEVGMVAHGRPQQNYPAYQHVAAITPATNAIQQPGYQPQFQQYPQQLYQQQQPRPQAQRTQFDPIPMKYADLLPALLEKNLVQTRPPPKVPERLPTWYRPDKFCAFHQGAPGHDTEYCYTLKAAVQKLIRDKDLSFANPLPDHGT